MKKRMIKGNSDLHLHSKYSDGLYEPEDLVKSAVALNLKAVAITDHDCVDGVIPCQEAAQDKDLEIIPGVEMSAAIDGTEIHILGYFMDCKNAGLEEELDNIRKNRIKRMKMMVALLYEQGVDVDLDKLQETSGIGSIGRLHLAGEMVKTRQVKNYRQAFDQYIGDGKPCHVKYIRVDYKRAIEVIREAGGVAVLAHPGSMGKDEYISKYIEAGLRGIEVYHTRHTLSNVEKYYKIAKENDLLMTGGSDCHGLPTVKGMLMGSVRIDYELVQALRNESNYMSG